MTQKSPQTPLLKPELRMICEAKLSAVQSDEADQKPKGTIKAVATTFGARTTEDGRKFFYTKESFGDWADEMNAGGFKERPLPMFVNHMSENLPIGEWKQIECNDECMEIIGEIYTETSMGQDLLNILTRNPAMLPAVSIAPFAEAARWVNEAGEEIEPTDADEGYFQISKGGLREVSVVLHPANPKAEIKSLEKFLGNEANPRYIEKVLRDAGLKKDEAVMVTSVLKKEQLLRDAVVAQDKQDEAASDLPKSNETEILKALKNQQLLNRLKKWK